MGIPEGAPPRNPLSFRRPCRVQVPLLALRATPSSGTGNRSRFSGSTWVLAGRFGIVSRFRVRLVPFGSLRSCAGFGLGALLVHSKFESPPSALCECLISLAFRVDRCDRRERFHSRFHFLGPPSLVAVLPRRPRRPTRRAAPAGSRRRACSACSGARSSRSKFRSSQRAI